MKWIILFAVLCLIYAPGCSLREREKTLEKRLVEINQREQELLLREKSVQLREAELIKKERLIDSTLNTQKDTLAYVNQEVVGNWLVKMNCTETTCSGSAIGDTKTEQWEINYQGNSVIAKASSGPLLVRIYTGRSSGNTLELIAQSDDNAGHSTSITVKLSMLRDREMEGIREIISADGCKIVYALQLRKK